MSRDKRSLRKWIIVLSSVAVGTALLVAFSRNISSLLVQHVPVPYHKDDERLVKAAIAEIYGPGVSISEVKKHAYPVVIHLPDMACIGFNLRPGWIGVEQSVCFRTADGSVAIRHSR
jgi:hypothetical protein